MQYRIISVPRCCFTFSPAKTLEKLVKEVNAAIAQGWEPLGGITVIGTFYLQAMIKSR